MTNNFKPQEITLQHFFDENNIAINCDEYIITSFISRTDIDNNWKIISKNTYLSKYSHWYLLDGMNKNNENIIIIAIELEPNILLIDTIGSYIKLRKELNKYGYEFIFIDNYSAVYQKECVPKIDLNIVAKDSNIPKYEFCFQFKEELIYIIDDKYAKENFDTWNYYNPYWCFIYNINKHSIIRKKLLEIEKYFDEKL